MNWFTRLKLRWAMRQTTPARSALGFWENRADQHRQMSEDETFAAEHGYSAATAPAPWTEDISKHNLEVRLEYDAEVMRRQLAYSVGEYTPRFFIVTAVDDHGVATFANEVNWDLEMSLRPGARLDVTKETGMPTQPELTATDRLQAREAGALGRQIAALETDPVRKYVGSREEILRACDGNEEMADQVEAKARELLHAATR